MANLIKFPYHSLRQDEALSSHEEAQEKRACRKIRNFSGLKKFPVKKRIKVRVLGLRRFLRKKARFFSNVRIRCCKAVKKLKNGQAHLNDLFGGNFLVMQVSLRTPQCGSRPHLMGHGLQGQSSPSLGLGRVA